MPGETDDDIEQVVRALVKQATGGNIRTRLDEPAPVRTDHVILTEEGMNVADQL